MTELTLRDLISFSRDGEWGASEPLPGTTRMRVIRGTDFDSVRIGDYSTVPERWIDSVQAARKTLQTDDIVIESAGGSRDQITGRTLLIKESAIEDMSATCASFSRIIRADRTKILPRYLYWFLQNDHRNGDMHLFHVQHTGVSRFQFTEYARRTRVPIPDADVQGRIASLLGALEEKIAVNHRTNRALEAVAASVFASWFVEFDPVAARRDGRRPLGVPSNAIDLFPSHFEESASGPIPQAWRVSTIGAEVTVVGGSTPSTSEPKFWNGDVNWLTPRDLSRLDDPVVLETERLITPDGLRQISSGLLPAGTVLLSSRAPIGYIAMAEVPLAVNQGFIAMKCDKQLSRHYVLNWTRENLGEVLSRAGGTTFAEISKAAFRPIPVIVPPPSVIEVFDQVVGPLHAMLVANVQESRALGDLRDTLLGPLLSGELKISAAEKAVEAAI